MDRPIIFSAPMVRAMLDGRKTQTRRLIREMPEPPCHDSVVHPNPKHEHPYFDAYCGKPKTTANPRGMSDYWCWWTRDDREGSGLRIRYVPGDRLYVRENWRVSPEACEGWHPEEMRGWIDYQAGGSEEMVAPSFEAVEQAAFTKHDDKDWDFLPSRWRPCIHMPRWTSRLTLIVEAVKVERLQEISEADCLAEGPRVKGYAEFRFGRNGADYAPSSLDGVMVHTDQEHVYATPRCWYRELWSSLHTKPGERWEENPWVVAITFRVLRGNIDRLPQ